MARPRSDIQPRIVQAARAQFLTRGVDGASLRQIAREAGTSIGMIYYYYPTKDELFLAAVEEIYARLIAELAALLSADAPAEARLCSLSARIGRMSDEERDVAKLILREALLSTTRRERLLERFRRGHLALVAQTILGGAAAGEIDTRHAPVVLMMASFAVCAMPQAVIAIAGDTPPFDDAPRGEALAAQLVDVLFHGIAPRDR